MLLKMLNKSFKINSTIYPDNYMMSAIEDFEDVAGITFSNWNLDIKGDTEDNINEIFNELMNYVIWLINE